MGRRKKGNPVHGWVILDKPMGMTSTQAVAAVRRIFNAQKAGHAGTLDPMATGILAIALGEATKTVPYAMDADKTYRFTATWGEARDSDDTEGAVTGTLGHVSALRRTQLGSWDEKGAVGLDTLTPFMHSPAAFGYLRPLATALDGIPALAVSGPDTVRIRSGNPVLIKSDLFARMRQVFGDGELIGQTVFLKEEDGSPVALAEIAGGELRPFRVFNFSPDG